MTVSETPWTPGPWSIRRSRDRSGDIGITHPGGRNVLAECFADIRHAAERSTEAVANAHLIAKAPELYECVVAALNMVDGDGTPPDWDHLRKVAAKVRGEKAGQE
jgi:hypothetical protein